MSRLDKKIVFRLAADLLEMASDQFANHGCNDWTPEDLTPTQRKQLAELAYEANGSPADEKPELVHTDWWAMATMAHELRNLAGES